MLKIYLDYNILGRLLDKKKSKILPSTDPRWLSDNDALEEIWESFENKKIDLITCEDDCLMEFIEYSPEKIKAYQEIESHLTGEMLEKYLLFKKLTPGKLLITPWGEYGFGRGPWGGGPKKHWELLTQIRIMLNKPDTKDGHKDRDARHLMHCVLYGCDYFITMDYRIVDHFNQNFGRIKWFMEQRNHSLCVVNPREFLNLIRTKG